MIHRTLGSMAVLAMLLMPALAKDDTTRRQEASELIGLAEQGRAAIAALENALTRLRQRISELESELSREPAAGGAPTRDAAIGAIEQLRAQANALADEIRQSGPALADVLSQARDAAAETLATFAKVEPNREAITRMLGSAASPRHSAACDLSTVTASQFVVCRTQALADQDRQLSSLVDLAKRTGSAVQQRTSDQEQRDFYARLPSCAYDFGAISSAEGIRSARDCIARRYAARLSFVERDLPEAAVKADVRETGNTKFVTTRSNVRSQPSTSGAVLGRLEACAEVRIVSSAANGEWAGIASFTGTAYIATFLLADSSPSECLRAVRGVVQQVVDPGTIVVADREVRLFGIVPSKDDRSRRGMAEILALYGNQVSCRHSQQGRFICETPRWNGLESLDVAFIAVFNGGACPGPNALPEYRNARQTAVERGATLQCP